MNAAPPTLRNVELSESRATEVNVVGWVFTGIAIATVFLKLFARSQVTNMLGWDDFFIFLSLILSIIATALVSYSVTLGLGQHTAVVIAEHGPERLMMTAKWQMLGFPFNIGSFSFPNISIAILVNNLLDPNPLRTGCLFTISILQVVFAMISVILIFAQCTPVSQLWNPLAGGSCWDPSIFNDFTYFVTGWTTMTDIVLAVVPISVFWKLKMRMSTKLGLCIMMGLTLLSAVVTIVKATYLHLFTERIDPLYKVVPLVLWGLIEQNVVIVAACIPTLRPFFHKALGARHSSSRSPKKSHSRSASTYKLGSNVRRLSCARRSLSVDEVPLDKREDGQSESILRGIWQTREVRVESHVEGDGAGEVESRVRKMVPESLRTATG